MCVCMRVKEKGREKGERERKYVREGKKEKGRKRKERQRDCACEREKKI